MGITNSTVINESNITNQRMNIPMTQNLRLVWLDKNIDEYDEYWLDKITELRTVVHDFIEFTDRNECIQSIINITDTKTCIIISGTFGKGVVPHIHNLPHVDSIFILCDNDDNDNHEEWINEWRKIKGVYTEISQINENLKQIVQQCEQNATSISFMSTNNDTSSTNSDHFNPTFMYTQIFKEILLKIEFNNEHREEFFEYCKKVYAENEIELYNVKIFQKKYHPNAPIWLYTKESFLYKMLNRALRLLDVGIIIKLGFFIVDLHRQIEELHHEQFNNKNVDQILTVYRGQGMSTADFEQMKNLKGGLLSFNNFLSTSKRVETAHRFLSYGDPYSDMVNIIFVMTINSPKSSTPFASINEFSSIKNEDEVLFSMNSIFRIDNIILMDEKKRRFQVNLTLTDRNDKDLCILTNRIREEMYPHETGWHQLGLLLLRLDQSEKASQIYEGMLKQRFSEAGRTSIYQRLAVAKHQQGKYQEALELLEKVSRIYEKQGPTNRRLIAPYTTTGMVYNDMGEYEKALSSYEKALHILNPSDPIDYTDLAKCYNNIGEVYLRMPKYEEAFQYFQKARIIQEERLPPNHPDCIYPYKNIGDVYDKVCNWSTASWYYEQAAYIGERSLPSYHRDLHKCKNALRLLKEKL